MTSGATENAVETIFNWYQDAKKRNSIKIIWFADRKLAEYSTSMGDPIPHFSYSESEFAGLSLVIARPGIGIITDCVRYNVPILALYEEGNLEMIHNAKRIDDLGIGMNVTKVQLSASFSMDDILLDDNKLNRFKSNLINQPVGGALAAAFYINKSFEVVL